MKPKILKMKTVYVLIFIILIFLYSGFDNFLNGRSLSSKKDSVERKFDFQKSNGTIQQENSLFSYSSIPARNFRVYPSQNNQSETPIVIHPWNPDVIFGSAIISNNLIRGYYSGSYVSRDGGYTWSGGDALIDYFGNKIATIGDPSLVIDKDGVFVISYIAPPLGPNRIKIGSSYSTNYGTTWSRTVYVPQDYVYRADKLFSTTDINPQSNYYGRIYLTYSEVSNANPTGRGIYLSYSDNSGKTWTQPRKVSPQSINSGFGCDVRTHNGKVYVVWMHSNAWLGFAVSTDGGNTFSANANAERMNNVGIVNYTSALTNGLPRMDIDANGVIYVVTTEVYDDDADVILHKTDDDGVTWSKTKVNQDTDFNCNYQFQPSIRVDELGGVNVLYYDSRNTPTSDSLEMYISRSKDGGENFMDFLVSDHKFKNTPISNLFEVQNYVGSYIGLTSGNNKLYPLWFDKSTGVYQAWTNMISLDSIPPQIGHYPALNTGNIPGPFNIECNVRKGSSDSDPHEVMIYWFINNSTVPDSALMQKDEDKYVGQIISNDSESVYRYYIKVTDSLGLSVASPEHAPAVLHSFTAATDFVAPVINHESSITLPHAYWPSSIFAEVTDSSGIDSVRVVWYKNIVGNSKSFDLRNISGNYYYSSFNSDTLEISPGNVIFYRIIAVDNSFARNERISPLYPMIVTDEIPILCEDFLSPAFPPNGLRLVGTDSSYWSRNDIGSYNSGLTGSLKFDFYNVAPATTQSVVIYPFAMFDGDNLIMDFAYAPNQGTDSLIIETSTNSGFSFEPLLGMAGGENNDSLNTAPQTSIPFVPDSTQWRTLLLSNLPSNTNGLKIKAVSGNGGNNLFLDNICIRNFHQPDTFTVKLILQGLFDPSADSLYNTDTLFSYLRSSHYPYNIIDSSRSMEYDRFSFESSFLFENAGSGNYYIVIKHRNSIETWSKTAISYIKGEKTEFDFTSSVDKAYGNNMILLGSYYCIYSGDVDQNGIVDTRDLELVINDFIAGATGYIPTDLNGNFTVDEEDYNMVFQNSTSFIFSQTPFKNSGQ